MILHQHELRATANGKIARMSQHNEKQELVILLEETKRTIQENI